VDLRKVTESLSIRQYFVALAATAAAEM